MGDVTKRCFQCSKGLLYTVNVLFWMLGAALLGLGIWLYLTNDRLLSIAPGYKMFMPAALFITPGCLSIIVGFVGCCGAVMENKCMIISYCILTVIVLVMELVVAGATLSGNLHVTAMEAAEQRLLLSINERYPGANAQEQYEHDMVQGWDVLQQKFKCCGVISYTDWHKSYGWPTLDRVPDSCCIRQYVNCGLDQDLSNIYTEGCSKPTEDFLIGHLLGVAITTLVFAALQMLTIVGALVFIRFHRRHKELH